MEDDGQRAERPAPTGSRASPRPDPTEQCAPRWFGMGHAEERFMHVTAQPCGYALIVRTRDGRPLRISKYARLDVAIEALKVERALGHQAQLVVL